MERMNAVVRTGQNARGAVAGRSYGTAALRVDRIVHEVEDQKCLLKSAM